MTLSDWFQKPIARFIFALCCLILLLTGRHWLTDTNEVIYLGKMLLFAVCALLFSVLAIVKGIRNMIRRAPGLVWSLITVVGSLGIVAFIGYMVSLFWAPTA
jgi:hypothetical protein